MPPGGGDRGCRLCLSNETTSHSGPMHQKTQKDQYRTAGPEWAAVLVEAAAVSKALTEKHWKKQRPVREKSTCGVFIFPGYGGGVKNIYKIYI